MQQLPVQSELPLTCLRRKRKMAEVSGHLHSCGTPGGNFCGHLGSKAAGGRSLCVSIKLAFQIKICESLENTLCSRVPVYRMAQEQQCVQCVGSGPYDSMLESGKGKVNIVWPCQTTDCPRAECAGSRQPHPSLGPRLEASSGRAVCWSQLGHCQTYRVL